MNTVHLSRRRITLNDVKTNNAATAAPVAKKAYSSPEFVVYGDVRQLTHTVATSGGNDGGGAGTSKTM